MKSTRLSSRSFKDNQAWLSLFAHPNKLGNFVCRLALSGTVKQWALTMQQ